MKKNVRIRRFLYYLVLPIQWIISELKLCLKLWYWNKLIDDQEQPICIHMWRMLQLIMIAMRDAYYTNSKRSLMFKVVYMDTYYDWYHNYHCDVSKRTIEKLIMRANSRCYRDSSPIAKYFTMHPDEELNILSNNKILIDYEKELGYDYYETVKLFRSALKRRVIKEIDKSYVKDSLKYIQKMVDKGSLNKDDLNGAKVIILQEEQSKYLEIVDDLVDKLMPLMHLPNQHNPIGNAFNNFNKVIKAMQSYIITDIVNLYSNQFLVLFCKDRLELLNYNHTSISLDDYAFEYSHLTHNSQNCEFNNSPSIMIGKQIKLKDIGLMFGINAITHVIRDINMKLRSIRMNPQISNFRMFIIMYQADGISDQEDKKILNYYMNEIPCYLDQDPEKLCSLINYYFDSSLTYKVVLNLHSPESLQTIN